MSMTHEAQEEVAKLLRKGEKIGAIKHLKETYGFSLEQSKILVEAMEGTLDTDSPYLKSRSTSLDESALAHVSDLLRKGKKIDAIRFVKDSLGIRLKQARTIVEDLDRSLHPGRKAAMTHGPGLIVSIIFGSIGTLFLAIAGYIFYSQSLSIGKSDLVTGRVIRLETKSDGMSAPVIEYEWNGQRWLYASKTYTSPPAYTVDETMSIYVNREDAADIIVDTFSDRWFLITVLGSMGLIFTGIPVLIGVLGARRERQMSTVSR